MRHCLGNYNVAQLSSLGVYIVGKVKAGVDGCGGNTIVVAVRTNCDLALTEMKNVMALESDFLAKDEAAAKVLTNEIVANPLALSWISRPKKAIPS